VEVERYDNISLSPYRANDKPVKWRKVRRRRVVRMCELDWFALLLLASIVLLFDALVIGRHVGIIRLPGELSVLDMARLGAMSYVDMQRTMLERDEFAGVGSADPVLRDAAEGLTDARSTEETGRELAKASTKLYEAVQADRLYARREGGSWNCSALTARSKAMQGRMHIF